MSVAGPDPWGVLEELRATRRELAEVRGLVEDMRTAASAPRLEPLSDILGISKRAALGRLSKDADLRALAHRLGRSLVFRACEVQALLASRQREKAGGR